METRGSGLFNLNREMLGGGLFNLNLEIKAWGGGAI